MTTTPDFRALCAELLDKYDLEWRARELIKAALAAPPPEPPTVMEIIALSDEIEKAGLGRVGLVRAALKMWGNG